MGDTFEVFRETEQEKKSRISKYIYVAIMAYAGYVLACCAFEAITRKVYKIPSNRSIEAIKDKKCKIKAMSERNKAEYKRDSNPIASIYLLICLAMSCIAGIGTFIFLFIFLFRHKQHIKIMQHKLIAMLIMVGSCFATMLFLIPPLLAEWYCERYG